MYVCRNRVSTTCVKSDFAHYVIIYALAISAAELLVWLGLVKRYGTQSD